VLQPSVFARPAIESGGHRIQLVRSVAADPWRLVGGNFGEVALEPVLGGHALGWRTLDVGAAHHLVLGASRPILCVAFGAKGLGRGRHPVLRMTAFQVPAGVLTMVGMDCSRTGLVYCHRTETVPTRR